MQAKIIATQKGYLLIMAMVLLVMIGGAIAFWVHGYTSEMMGRTTQLVSQQAFYIGSGGLENGTLDLLNPNLSQRLNCPNVVSDTQSFGAGLYQLSGTRNYPATIITLTSSINATAATIPVSSTASLASRGRVWIDKEAMDYQRINGNNLEGVTRGVSNTVATAHSVVSRISQYQCTLTSTGFVSNTATPIGRRIQQVAVPLQVIHAVGQNGTFRSWNQPTENTWTTQSGSPNRDMNALSLLNAADGWAVGDSQGSNSTIRRFNPTTNSWDTVSFTSNRDFNGVSAVSSSEAWIVGQRNGGTHLILRWDAATWCQVQTSPSCGGKQITSSVPNNRRNLFSVSVIDTNQDGLGELGFAVGGRSANGHILRYNGSQWVDNTVPGSVGQLDSVFTVSSNEAWAAGRASSGNAGRILRWNGTSWSVAQNTNRRMRSIYMVDTDQDGLAELGWAVGDNGRAYRYNGSTWTRIDIGINAAFRGVAIFKANDAWAVGNGGRRVHWDGNNWSLIASGGSRLNGIAIVKPGPSPKAAWQEVFS